MPIRRPPRPTALSDLLLRLGLSQRKVLGLLQAGPTPISQQRLSRLVRGQQQPRPAEVEALAQVLGVRPDEVCDPVLLEVRRVSDPLVRVAEALARALRTDDELRFLTTRLACKVGRLAEEVGVARVEES